MERHDFIIKALKNLSLTIIVVMCFFTDSVDVKLDQIMVFLFLAEFWNTLSR